MPDTVLPLLQMIVTVVAAVFASSGFWLFVERKRGTRGLSRRLLTGLAHDRITHLAMKYIHRGWITRDEYENLCEFLYTPYKEMGGNGAADRLMKEVDKLKIFNTQEHIADRLERHPHKAGPILKGDVPHDSE